MVYHLYGNSAFGFCKSDGIHNSYNINTGNNLLLNRKVILFIPTYYRK